MADSQRKADKILGLTHEEHVRISDYSDRELLAIMADLNGTGEVTSRQVSLRVFGIADLEENAEKIAHATKCVGTRLSWMRRYGLVEKGEKASEWLISEPGLHLLRSRMRTALSNSIVKTDASLDLANVVGEKLVAAGKVEGRAMQRELQFQITRRKRQPWY